MNRKKATRRPAVAPKPVRYWKSLDAVWNRLLPQRTAGAFGVLLIGPSAETEKKAMSLAHEKSSNVVVVRPGEQRVDGLVKSVRQWLLTKDTLLEKVDLPVLVVLNLEGFHEKMHGFLKGRLETDKRLWLCIATCENARDVPDYCGSMFYQVKELLRSPRRQSKK